MRSADVRWSEGAPAPDELVDALMPGLAGDGEEMDARVFVMDQNGKPTAWASVWWRNTPELEGRRIGAIGGFGADDRETAACLLGACGERLKSEDCRLVVGPMNGNTWRPYRFVVESDGRGPFFMEPRNPADYPEWWRAAGFEEMGGYSSSVVPLTGEATVPDLLRERLMAGGVVLREMDLENFDAELEVIYQVTLAGFAANFLYTPLGRESFIGAYQKIRGRVDPRFVCIAERGGRACGYVFAIADLEAAARGEEPALIIKTLTVDPAARCAGLGSVLVDEVQRRGHAAGFREALHVLQYDDNNVLRITRRHGGRRFRRYALFSKTP